MWRDKQEHIKVEVHSTWDEHLANCNLLTAHESDIDRLTQDLIFATERIEQLQAKLASQEPTTLSNEFIKRLETVESNLHHQKSKTSLLEASHDDQTNRNMRTTLVIRNLPEDTDKTMNKTTKILAKFLANIDIDENNTIGTYGKQIERAHLSNPTPTNDESSNHDGPRPIFVRFQSWKDSEKCKRLIVNYNKSINEINNNPSNTKIYVDQLYSKPVQLRRKKAFEERKKLRENQKDTPMFVKDPADLMIKVNGKYTCHKKF